MAYEVFEVSRERQQAANDAVEVPETSTAEVPETMTTEATNSAGGPIARLLTKTAGRQMQGVGASVLNAVSQTAFGDARRIGSSLLKAFSPKILGEAGPSSLPFPARLHSIGSHLFGAVSHAAQGHSYGDLRDIAAALEPHADAVNSSGDQHTIVEIPEAPEITPDDAHASLLSHQPPAAHTLAPELNELGDVHSGRPDGGSALQEADARTFRAPSQAASRGIGEQSSAMEAERRAMTRAGNLDHQESAIGRIGSSPPLAMLSEAAEAGSHAARRLLPNIGSSALGQIHALELHHSTPAGASEGPGSSGEWLHGASQSALAKCMPQSFGRLLIGHSLQDAEVSPEGPMGGLQEWHLEGITGHLDSPVSLLGSLRQAATVQAEQTVGEITASAIAATSGDPAGRGSVIDAAKAAAEGQPLGLEDSLLAVSTQGLAMGRRGPISAAFLGAVAKKTRAPPEPLPEAQVQPSRSVSDQDLSTDESSSPHAGIRIEHAEPDDEGVLEPLLASRSITELGINRHLLQSLLPMGVALAALCMLKMVQQVTSD